jgi:hypothetical protein
MMYGVIKRTKMNVDMPTISKDCEDCATQDVAIENNHKNCLLYLVCEERQGWNVHVFTKIFTNDNVQMLEFVVQNNYHDIDDSIIVNALMDKKYKCLTYLINKRIPIQNVNNVLTRLIKISNFDLFKKAINNGYQFESNIIDIVAQTGDLDLLTYMIEVKSCKVSTNTIKNALLTENLKCFNLTARTYRDQVKTDPTNYQWDPELIDLSIKTGTFDNFNTLERYGCPITGKAITMLLTYKGHDLTNRLQHLINEYIKTNKCEWDLDSLNQAIRFNHLQCYRIMLDNGFPVNISHLNYCLENGIFDYIKNIHENSNIDFDENSIIYTLNSNNFNCIHYVIDNNAPINNEALVIAIQKGYLEILIKLLNNGYEISSKLTDEAILNTNFPALKYLVETRRCPFSSNACAYAISVKNMNILEYAKSKGAKFIDNITEHACKKDSLDCLFHLINRGCQLTNKCIFYCIQFGSLNCLKYIVKTTNILTVINKNIIIDLKRQNFNGETYTDNRYYISISIKNLDCIKYMLSSGFSLEPNIINDFIDLKNNTFIKFAIDNGVNWKKDSLDRLMKTHNFEGIEYCISDINKRSQGNNTSTININDNILSLTKFINNNIPNSLIMNPSELNNSEYKTLLSLVKYVDNYNKTEIYGTNYTSVFARTYPNIYALANKL